MQALRQEQITTLRALLPNPTHSVSISLKYRHPLHSNYTKLIYASSSARWFLHVLNDKCLGKSRRRLKKWLGYVVVAEGMGPHKRLHLHLAMRKPIHLNTQVFERRIKQSASKTRNMGNIDVQAYYDGWYGYITKEDDCEILIEQCQAGTV